LFLLFYIKKSSFKETEREGNLAMPIFEYMKDFTALAMVFTAAYLWMLIM